MYTTVEQYTEYRTTGVTYGYGIIYLPSECDAFQAPVPTPADEWQKTGLPRRSRGKAGVGSFPGQKLAGYFSQNESTIGPSKNAFPGLL